MRTIETLAIRLVDSIIQLIQRTPLSQLVDEVQPQSVTKVARTTSSPIGKVYQSAGKYHVDTTNGTFSASRRRDLVRRVRARGFSVSV